MATPRSSLPLRPVLLAALAGLLVGRELGLDAARPEPAARAAVRRWAPSETPSMVTIVGGQRWAHARDAAAGGAADHAERLAQIGYADGVTAWHGEVGVTRHAGEAVAPGLNLAVFGHAQGALLLDDQGAVRHRWSLDLAEHLPPDQRLRHDHWRRVRLLDDGGLLAIYEGQYLVRLDRHSELLWCRDLGAHHDLDVDPQGRLLVLTREPRLVPRLDPVRPVLDDAVSVLDDQGRVLDRVSLIDALENSPWASLLERAPRDGDPLHTNTLERLDGRLAPRLPAFAAGNLLLSFREIDTIAVLDLEARAIVWALSGPWRAQHQPTVLEDGHLLIFDNKGAPGGRSRVLEIDPATQRLAWSFTDSEAEPFHSDECGTAQRLPGGNTLITETDGGRAFEVDPQGRVVWEYRSPFRAGDRGQYVSTLFELERLPQEAVSGWLPAAR